MARGCHMPSVQYVIDSICESVTVECVYKMTGVLAGRAGLYHMSYGNWRTTKAGRISIERDRQRGIRTNRWRS